MAVVVLGCVGVGFGAERFPPPQFESQYVRPVLTAPAARSITWEVVDVGVLVAALVLASYLVLYARSRKALFALTIFSILYFGFWRRGCICPVGSIQNVALALFDSTYAIPLSVVLFFVAPLVFTLFFGRTFCAAVCPLGAVQDMVAVWPLPVPRWLDAGLRVLAYLYLGLAVVWAALGSAFVVCRYDPFVALFRLSGDAAILVLGVALLVVGLFVGRPYCRFLCPYGVILRQLSKLSRRRVTITPDDCIRCGLCARSCPFDAIQGPAQPWPQGYEVKARRRLVWWLCLAPVLILAPGILGLASGPAMARMDPTVRLAQRIWQEEQGIVQGTTDATAAFRATGQALDDLYASASRKTGRYRLAGCGLGAFMGLVIAAKGMRLSVWRRRSDYEADRAACVACGRCYVYCPMDHQRRKGGEQGRSTP
jgi:NosR/NirI family nitrous oxide reductase transcriptional regulator